MAEMLVVKSGFGRVARACLFFASLIAGICAIGALGGAAVAIAHDGHDHNHAVDDRPIPTDPAALSEEWASLVKEREKLAAELQKIQDKGVAATKKEDQEALRKEFQAKVAAFENTFLARMNRLAPYVYASDPANFDAGSVALDDSFRHNRYETAVDLADKMIKAGRKDPILLNVAAVSNYAIQNFQRAKELMNRLELAGQMHPQLAGQYADANNIYAQIWPIEQKIRKEEEAAPEDKLLPRVKFVTTKGDIVLELFENEAPNTVANFVSLVEKGFYNGTKFHRVIPQFMAQGGDPNSKDDLPGNDGQGGPGYVIPCECYQPNARPHYRGSISMAHGGKDTGGSQFFLTHLPTAHLNANPQEKKGHTVFGRVIEGIDVVGELAVGDEIREATVLRKRNHDYVPQTALEKPKK